MGVLTKMLSRLKKQMEEGRQARQAGRRVIHRDKKLLMPLGRSPYTDVTCQFAVRHCHPVVDMPE